MTPPSLKSVNLIAVERSGRESPTEVNVSPCSACYDVAGVNAPSVRPSGGRFEPSPEQATATLAAPTVKPAEKAPVALRLSVPMF